jgi:photosystem II stability/assembly factor-like uncharacterized protein
MRKMCAHRFLLLVLIGSSLAYSLPAWELLGPPGGEGPLALAVNPRDPDLVLGVWRVSSLECDLYRSTDAGRSWVDPVRIESASGGSELHPVWDAQAPGVAYTGLVVPYGGSQAFLYRTTDCGRSWDPLAVTEGNPRGWVLADSQVGGRLFLGQWSGGLLRSVDGGDHFSEVEGDAGGRRAALWTDPDDPSHLLLVSSAVFVSHDGGASFELLGNQLKWGGGSILSDPLHPDRLLCAAYGDGEYGIWRSDDQGASWDRELELYAFTPPPLVVDPGSGWVFAATEYDGFFLRPPSTPNRWQRGRLPAASPPRSLAVVGSGAADLLLGNRPNLFRNTIPPLEPWRISASGLEKHEGMRVHVAPEMPELLLVLDNAALLVSEDGGASWRYLDGGEEPIYGWGATLLQGGRVVVYDAERGVGWSDDLGATWEWEHPEWFDAVANRFEYLDLSTTSRADPSRPLTLTSGNGWLQPALYLHIGPDACHGEWRSSWAEDLPGGCGMRGASGVDLSQAMSSWEQLEAVYAVGWTAGDCGDGAGWRFWFQCDFGERAGMPEFPDKTLALDVAVDAPAECLALARVDPDGGQALSRRDGDRWREVARGGVVDRFRSLVPVPGGAGEAWVAAGSGESWLSRDGGAGWVALETPLDLWSGSVTADWLPQGTILAAGSAGVYRLQEIPTGVDAGAGADDAAPVPSMRLGAPYPVPANPRVSIPFTLGRAARVELSLYDLRGTKVRALLRDELSAGNHLVVWDGRTESGLAAPSGIYWVRLRGGGAEQRRSVVLLR